MRILSEKQYKELIEESEDIACKDTFLMLEKWKKMQLLPLNCIEISLSIILSLLVEKERKKEVDLKHFLDHCIEEANKIADIDENE
jgi:hypothetical protein